jgi:XTP/dITP diphosphohydrolase
MNPAADADGGVHRLVLASDNQGKLAELRALLQPLGVQVQAQGSLGITAAEEPHGTFVENALAKARHAAQRSGLPALADDSGLCCDALGGLPGVRSARFSGEGATDARNNAYLQQQLAGQSLRSAHYHCVIVALRAADDPEPLIADGRWDGEIVDAPRGSGGFGYDPYFWLPALQVTAAQLDPAVKNRLSHRAQAMQALLGMLRTRWLDRHGGW